MPGKFLLKKNKTNKQTNKARFSYRGREGELERCYTHWLIDQTATMARAGPGGSQVFNPSFLSKNLGHPLQLSQGHYQEAELELE